MRRTTPQGSLGERRSCTASAGALLALGAIVAAFAVQAQELPAEVEAVGRARARASVEENWERMKRDRVFESCYRDGALGATSDDAEERHCLGVADRFLVGQDAPALEAVRAACEAAGGDEAAARYALALYAAGLHEEGALRLKAAMGDRLHWEGTFALNLYFGGDWYAARAQAHPVAACHAARGLRAWRSELEDRDGPLSRLLARRSAEIESGAERMWAARDE